MNTLRRMNSLRQLLLKLPLNLPHNDFRNDKVDDAKLDSAFEDLKVRCVKIELPGNEDVRV